MLKITEPEYVLMKQFIEDHCGIHLEHGKEYLIESRLSDLVAETGCQSFQQFHLKARLDASGGLKDRIVDAMTTNETLWFRDAKAWAYLNDMAVPELLDRASRTGKARIWSAASSTGQEAYSLLMLLDGAVRARGAPDLLDRIEILGTDISSSALFLANAARYDVLAMGRGLPPDKKEKYFVQQGKVWCFNEKLKKRVTFKKFNLQRPFNQLGFFDLILLRYVIIYFSDEFKRRLFQKMAGVMRPGGVLLLGASETLRNYTVDFEIQHVSDTIINVRK